MLLPASNCPLPFARMHSTIFFPNISIHPQALHAFRLHSPADTRFSACRPVLFARSHSFFVHTQATASFLLAHSLKHPPARSFPHMRPQSHSCSFPTQPAQQRTPHALRYSYTLWLSQRTAGQRQSSYEDAIKPLGDFSTVRAPPPKPLRMFYLNPDRTRSSPKNPAVWAGSVMASILPLCCTVDPPPPLFSAQRRFRT